MTDVNLKPSQRTSIVGTVDPQSASSVKTSGWIDATTFHNFLAMIMVGAIGDGATLNGKLQQATDSGGTGAKDVTGKAMTQLSGDITPPDSSKQVLLDLKQEDLDFANGFKWFRLSITPATAATLIGGIVMGLDSRYGFATDNDATTVAEVV